MLSAVPTISDLVVPLELKITSALIFVAGTVTVKVSVVVASPFLIVAVSVTSASVSPGAGLVILPSALTKSVLLLLQLTVVSLSPVNGQTQIPHNR